MEKPTFESLLIVKHLIICTQWKWKASSTAVSMGSRKYSAGKFWDFYESNSFSGPEILQSIKKIGVRF